MPPPTDTAPGPLALPPPPAAADLAALSAEEELPPLELEPRRAAAVGLELPLELLLLDFDLDDFFLEEDDLEERVDLSFSDAEEADDSCRLVDFLSEPFPSSLLKDLLNPNLTILQSVIVWIGECDKLLVLFFLVLGKLTSS